MKQTMKTMVLAALALFAMTACTRRVQVESEPNEPRYMEQISEAQTMPSVDVAGADGALDGAAPGR